jgi:tetratricopeptide (TPR) repeat protein
MLPKIFERSDLPLSDEEIADRRYRRRRLTIIVGALVVLILVGLVSARPAVNAVRAWQARRHAQKAFEFMDQQKWTEARTEAVAAYQLRSTEPEAIRAVARLLSRAGQADAIGFWKELKSRTSLTSTDLRDEANIAVKSKETEVAEAAISQLLSSPDVKPSDELLAAQLAIQKQDLDGAFNRVQKVLKNSAATGPDQLQATLLLANILRGKDAKDQTEIFDNLVRLARGMDDVALDALVALGQTYLSSDATWPNPSGMTVDELIRDLETHPSAKPQHKLLAFDLRIHQHPDQREEIIHNAVAQFKTGDNATVLALAAWLNSRGEHQLELDAIPRDRSMQSRDLFFQHVDALGALGRWDEIRKLIESEQFPLDPVVEHMYLARCFAQQGQTNGAENNWKRALEAAAGDANKLITLADYAEKNNELVVASAAYQAAVAASPKLRVAQQGRLRVAYAMRNTKEIHTILVELLKIWPNDTAVQNDEAYARLLLMPGSASDNHQPITDNPDLSAIEQLADNLVKREPASLPHRTLLALARLKQNRPYDALAVYRGINVPRNALTTSTLSVHVAILAATNDKDGAAKEAASLPKDKLLPEEQALVDEALK